MKLLLLLFCIIVAFVQSKESVICQLSERSANIVSNRQTLSYPEAKSDNRRLVAIGDVHGSYSGLLDVLYGSSITISRERCEWKHQNKGTVLVQVGDLVDRGPNAWEAFQCLRFLQQTADSYNSKVVRLVGSKHIFKR